MILQLQIGCISNEALDQPQTPPQLNQTSSNPNDAPALIMGPIGSVLPYDEIPGGMPTIPGGMPILGCPGKEVRMINGEVGSVGYFTLIHPP